MIRIAISQAAFHAISATLPLGSVGFERDLTARTERLIWLERRVLDRPGGRVILRLVEIEATPRV
jgi:hypothetical protein